MRTIKVSLYEFDELSEPAKDRAVQHYHNINTDYEWWDSVYEDWKTKLTEQGFTNAKIYFSGFWSQGDGACFESEIDFDRQFELFKASMLENGNARMQRAFRNHENWIYDYLYNETTYRIVRTSSRYSHEYSVKIEPDCHRYTKGILNDIYTGFTAWLENQRLEFSRQIYRDLEAEYGYLSSDKAIIETIRINGFEFTGNGEAA